MKTIVSVLIVMISVAVAHGQQRGKVVFWSGDPGCGFRSKSVPPEDIYKCNSIQTDRGPVSTITHDGVSLLVAFLEDDTYNIVGASIINRSSEFVAFDTEMWGAAHFKTKAAFQAREQPLVAETSIPTRDILRVMAKRIRNESSLDTFIADGQKAVETREVRNSDGTRVKVDVVVPDKDTQQAVVRRNSARAEMVINEQRQLRETALTARFVQAQGSVTGLVYFRRVRNADFVVFSLIVDGTTYVFQLPRNKRS